MSDERQRQKPQSVVPRTDAEFGAFLAYLLAAIGHLDELDQCLTPDQAILAQPVKDDLIALNDSVKIVIALVMGQSDYIKRLLAQRHSAWKAFETGWNARYEDIASRLNDEEYAQLRHALEHIAIEDMLF